MPRLVFSWVLLTAGCTATVERFTVDQVLDRGRTVPDMGKACALGSSLAYVLAATGSVERPPHLAMVIAEATAATCDEAIAWEAELTRLRQNPADEAAITDASLLERRAHASCAVRFWRAWQYAQAAFEPTGEQCPHIDKDDEVVWLISLISGMLAVMHDKASGTVNAVPLDIIGKVGRGARCLDDQRWWFTPRALEASVGALIPGAAPAGVDPWAALEFAASQGEKSGVRVARALQIILTANADRGAELAAAIRAHRASLDSTPRSPDWALLDEYARLITLHHSDVIWTTSTRHRTPSLGTLPGETSTGPLPANPFE